MRPETITTTAARAATAARRRLVDGYPPHRAAWRALAVTLLLALPLLLAYAPPVWLARWAFVAVAGWAVLLGPTQTRRYQMIRRLHAGTQSICRDDEYAADHAQDLQHRWQMALFVVTCQWLIPARWASIRTRTYRELVRRRSRPRRHVRVHLYQDAPWWPSWRHIEAIDRRWYRAWEPGYMTHLERLKGQVAGIWRAGELDMDADMRRCVARFTRTTATGQDGRATAFRRLPDLHEYPTGRRVIRPDHPDHDQDQDQQEAS